MKRVYRLPLLLFVISGLCVPAISQAAHVRRVLDRLELSLSGIEANPQRQEKPLWLAANAMAMTDISVNKDADSGDGQWHRPWLTANKAHEYMGLGSLILAGLTVLTAPDSEGTAPGQAPSGKGLHEALAYGAVALGVGAVTTGFIYHFDDIHWDNGITDPDNLHMLLGLIGTAGYLAALSGAPEGPDYSGTSHATAGIIGAVSMLGAIKLEW